jgi:hypothetical protein
VELVHGSGELASLPGRILARETANHQHHRRDSEMERVPPRRAPNRDALSASTTGLGR